MNSTDRQFLIKHALMRALRDCRGYTISETGVCDAAEIKIDHLRPTVAEFAALLRSIEAERLIVAIHGERGRRIKLTEAGELWLAEHP